MHLSQEFDPGTLFLFIDESGDFDFSSSGSTHFVMAGVLSSQPTATALPLQRLRYQLLESGMNISSFHASPDLQEVRNQVLNEISQISQINTHVVFGVKQNLDPNLKSMEKMHSHFSTLLVQGFLSFPQVQGCKKLIVVIDQSLPPKKQAAFNLSIKPLFKKHRKEFHIFFQSMKTDYNGQIADYIAWSKFKQLERGEYRPWNLLTQTIGPTEMEMT